MKKLPVAVQALHRFWMSNHPWPMNPSKEWKTQRDLMLHAVKEIWMSSHPFCCDDLINWVRDLMFKVAYFPGFPVIRVPRVPRS
jgi:hypothetical protein